LNGALSKTLNGQPMEYHFEFQTTDPVGNPIGAWIPVTTAQFSATILGKRELYAPAFPDDPNPIKTSLVWADPANPGGGPLNAVIAGGWIRVPQFSNVFGSEGFFVPNGNMLNVITSSLVGSPAISVLGVKAGQSSTALAAPLAQNRHIAIKMRVREVGNPGSEIDAGTCFHVAIENTVYNGVAKGGSWAPLTVNAQMGVGSGRCAGVADERMRGRPCRPSHSVHRNSSQSWRHLGVVDFYHDGARWTLPFHSARPRTR
jgi:hypothetical protein